MSIVDYIVPDSKWIVVYSGETTSQFTKVGDIAICDGTWDIDHDGEGDYISIDFDDMSTFTYYPIDREFAIIVPVSLFDRKDIFKAMMSGSVDHLDWKPIVRELSEMAEGIIHSE